MGLRDLLKQKAKAILGNKPAAPPPAAPAPAVAASPPVPPASRPAPVGAVSRPPPGSPPPGTAAPAAPPVDGDYRAVAPASAVRDDKPGTYAHGKVNVAVFRLGNRLYAIDNACAHEDGPIGEGTVDGNCVRCPYHDWLYDFTTGACITEPDRQRATFAVKEEGGQIWLGPELTPGSESRGGDHDDGMEVIKQ